MPFFLDRHMAGSSLGSSATMASMVPTFMKRVGRSPHQDMQLNLMNARAIAMFAGSADRWAHAGDQLYVDLDLSISNLPPGTRLALGDAEIEITDQPHTGCARFSKRFGVDAFRLVNSPVGRAVNLRGACTRVTRSGTIRRGDTVYRIEPECAVTGCD